MFLLWSPTCILLLTCLPLFHTQVANSSTTPMVGVDLTTDDGGADINMTTAVSINATDGVETTVPLVTAPVTDPPTTFLFQPATVKLEFGVNRAIPFCTCDITISICDINCCCDRKCTMDDRSSFTSCDEILQLTPSTSHCVAASSIFLQNSPFTVDTSDGSFCVIKDEYQQQDYLSTPEIVRDDNVFNEYVGLHASSHSYSAATEDPSADDSSASEVNYKSGDYLQILDNQNSASIMLIPGGSGTLPTSLGCIDRTPAKFLHDSSVTCTREMKGCIAHGNGMNVEDHFPPHFRIISAPSVALDNEISENSLVDINLDTNGGTLYKTNLDPDTDVCYNVVTKVSYTVLHTSGVIQSVNLALETDNFNMSETSIQQTYAITYTDTSAINLRRGIKKSGNPGYEFGKPVISGWRNRGEDSITVAVAQANLRIISPTLSRNCDQYSRQSVTFGDDSMYSCILPTAAQDTATSAKCQRNVRLAKSVLLAHYLVTSQSVTTYIASFGNSDPYNAGDWVPLLSQDLPTAERCSGLTVTLKILYSTVGSLAKPQNRIVGAMLEYDAHHIPISSAVSLNTDVFTLVSIVTFIDVTEPTNSQVDPSVYSERSPTQFFYPFVWATSKTSSIYRDTHSYLLLLLLLPLSYYLPWNCC